MSSKRFFYSRIFVFILAAVFLILADVQAAAMPRVLILGTGGTIAGAANGNSATGYSAAKYSIQEVTANLPGLKQLKVHITMEQTANIASQNMNFQVWKALAERINKAVASNEADAFVITHGTDTLEETAFFLDQVLNLKNPVVMVGATRPATSISADGPKNLLNAIKTAVDIDSFGRGVLVCYNDRIFSARYAVKGSTWNLDTFKASMGGPLGFVDDLKVHYYTGCDSNQKKTFSVNLEKIKELPKVDIIAMYAGASAEAIDYSIKSGAKGIIIAGVGNGNMPDDCLLSCKKAAKLGIVVVRSTRVAENYVHRDHEFKDSDYGTYAAYDLTPQKARILTQLLIASEVKDPEKIQSAFNGDSPGPMHYFEED
ncbi:MAG: asparaginase [Candidatus Bruticola sp.]